MSVKVKKCNGRCDIEFNGKLFPAMEMDVVLDGDTPTTIVIATTDLDNELLDTTNYNYKTPECVAVDELVYAYCNEPALFGVGNRRKLREWVEKNID